MVCRIAFVLFPDFQQLDIAGPLAAFEVAERAQPGRYRWCFVASQTDGNGLVRSSSGLAWPAQPLPRLDTVDLVMVSGGDGVDAACADPALRRWLLRAAARGLRISSVCSGSLLLADLGLLDGRAATTHWSRTRRFQQRYPQVHLQPDRIWVHEPARGGPVPAPELWTSAGITAGIDLALALVGHDCGEAAARQVAQHLVVYHRRPGGQSQFSALLAVDAPQGRFAALLDHIRSHLAEPHRVEDLAQRACMSPRHFARAFQAETGHTPARMVERLRVEAARAAVQRGAASVQQVVRSCGFGQAERMRRAFQRLLGQPPAALKRQARAAA
jgi:transcriptional regulator GlxA family with amidase domain